MRAFGAVVFATLVSFLVEIALFASAAFVGVVARPGPHQGFEILATSAGLAIVSLGSAIVFAIVLAARGGRKAVGRTAIVLMVLLVAALATPAIFGMATTDPHDLMAMDVLRSLGLFLAATAVPGLVGIFVQWLIIRRHVGRKPTA